MNTETQIMTASPVNYAVEITPETLARKEVALAESALIARVNDATDQNTAVTAQKGLHEVISSVEKARKEHKAPLLEAGRKIDQVAADFLKELKEEELRVATLVGHFQEGELVKARAEEALRLKGLDDLEEARQTALAKAQTDDERDQINAEYCDAQRDMSPAPIARTAGQVVRHEWEITVTDLWALARNHPTCVDIKPRTGDIKNLLDGGFQVAGVTAKKVVKSTVRASKQREAIAV